MAHSLGEIACEEDRRKAEAEEESMACPGCHQVAYISTGMLVNGKEMFRCGNCGMEYFRAEGV